MEIYIVRHGEPDYEHDSLTIKGTEEARLLSKRLSRLDISAFYCSPLGRAKKTASYTLELMGRQATELKWLREFEGSVKTGLFKRECCWDRMPSYWTEIEDYYSYEKWHTVKLMEENGVMKYYREVCDGVDALLASHGYVHRGKVFEVVRENSDKLVLFCHFGVEAVILSHIFGMSPMILWHNFRALPSSVTRLVTEEREKGIASFACLQYGDLSHLYAEEQEPSFSARFCERFSDDTRH